MIVIQLAIDLLAFLSPPRSSLINQYSLLQGAVRLTLGLLHSKSHCILIRGHISSLHSVYLFSFSMIAVMNELVAPWRHQECVCV